MAKTFTLEIATPESEFYRGEVEIAVVRTTDGEEGFMADHAPCCKLLADGQVRFKEPGGDERRARTAGGFADVNGRVLVFADSAEWE